MELKGSFLLPLDSETGATERQGAERQPLSCGESGGSGFIMRGALDRFEQMVGFAKPNLDLRNFLGRLARNTLV